MDWKCRQGERCVCGGDTPAVRATCQQFIAAEGEPIPFPTMPRQEYEWLHCTLMPDQSMVLYRHRMSNRPVLVCSKKVAGGTNEHTTIWLPQEVVTLLKAKF